MHPNQQTVQRFYDAFARLDAEMLAFWKLQVAHHFPEEPAAIEAMERRLSARASASAIVIPPARRPPSHARRAACARPPPPAHHIHV